MALRAEITQLRKDLLQAEIEKVEALTGEKININLDNTDEENVRGQEQYNEIINAIPSTPTEENTTNTTTF